MKISINQILRLFLAGLFIFVACENPDEEEDVRLPLAIYLVADADTLLLLSDDNYDVDLSGIFAETSEFTVTNLGVLGAASYTYTETDTSAEVIKASRADWYSSDETVAKVDDGEIRARAAGSAMVWAAIGDIISDSLMVVVSTPQRAPDLIIDPPLVQLVFQDSTIVSGRITPGMDVTLTVAGDTTVYDVDGYFSTVVYLAEGLNTITVVAINNENDMSSTKTKIVTYYELDFAGITGHWEGETLTRPFSFDIYQEYGLYVINGIMSVDFTMLGGEEYIEDIVIAGLIKTDGTIDASLTKEWEGFTATGYLKGTFSDTSYARGSYGLKIKKEGLPTVAPSATWEAERTGSGN